MKITVLFFPPPETIDKFMRKYFLRMREASSYFQIISLNEEDA